jgi:hypothetical protein
VESIISYMSTSTYIIDAALVLLVLLQIRERPLTNRQLIRPLVILGVARDRAQAVHYAYTHGLAT